MTRDIEAEAAKFGETVAELFRDIDTLTKSVIKIRKRMIGTIEGYFGCYDAVWHEWPTRQIEKIYSKVIDQQYVDGVLSEAAWKAHREDIHQRVLDEHIPGV